MDWCEVKSFRFVKAIRKTTCIWVFQSNSINRYVFKNSNESNAGNKRVWKQNMKMLKEMQIKQGVQWTTRVRLLQKQVPVDVLEKKISESFEKVSWKTSDIVTKYFTKENFKINAEHCVWLKNFFPSFSLIHNPQLGVQYLQIKNLH